MDCPRRRGRRGARVARRKSRKLRPHQRCHLTHHGPGILHRDQLPAAFLDPEFDLARARFRGPACHRGLVVFRQLVLVIGQRAPDHAHQRVFPALRPIHVASLHQALDPAIRAPQQGRRLRHRDGPAARFAVRHGLPSPVHDQGVSAPQDARPSEWTGQAGKDGPYADRHPHPPECENALSPQAADHYF